MIKNEYTSTSCFKTRDLILPELLESRSTGPERSDGAQEIAGLWSHSKVVFQGEYYPSTLAHTDVDQNIKKIDRESCSCQTDRIKPWKNTSSYPEHLRSIPQWKLLWIA